jgi:hypothetical protein
MRAFRVCFVVFCLAGGLLAAESPFTGAWKLKPSQGDSTKATAKVEADEHNFKVNQQNVDEKGQSSSLTFQAKFDGKEYAVSGDPEYDSASILRISERELKVTWKKAGKRVGESDIRVSSDGKTISLNYTNYSESTPQQHTTLWEKQ